MTRDGTEAAGEAAALLEEALAHPLFWGAREIRAFSSASAEALQRLGRQDSLNGERARGGVSQGQGGFGEKTDEVSDPFYPVQKALRSLSAARVPASSLERMRRLLREAQSLEGACEEERKDSSVRVRERLQRDSLSEGKGRRERLHFEPVLPNVVSRRVLKTTLQRRFLRSPPSRPSWRSLS